MRNAELRSSGQRVINQKLSSRIYLYAAKVADVNFVFLTNVGNGLDRSDYL